MKKYFLTKGEKYFITDDKWKTYNLTSDLPTGYVKETNSTIKKKIDFIFNYGENNSKLIIKELRNIENLLIKNKGFKRTQFKDGYGTAFEVFSVSIIHSLPYDEVIEKYMVAGSKDAKIDAVYYDEFDEICYVYQVKLGHIDSETAQKTVENFEEYLTSETLSKKDVKDFLDFMSNFSFRKEVKDSKKIQYMLISSPTVAVNTMYYNVYTPTDIFNKYIEHLLTPPKDHSMKLKIEMKKEQLSMISETEFFSYVPAITLMDSLTQASKTDDRFYFLFRDNVRGKLSASKNIIETIDLEPDNFSKFNNGVSITGDVFYNGKYINVKNPSIVNGQQTIYTLKEAKKLNDILVPVFFRGTKNTDLKQKIAFYNNTQKQIKIIDLMSIDYNVRKLQTDLLNLFQKDEKSYYLNIYTQGSASYLKKAKKLIDKNSIIKLNDFFKLYYSITTPDNIGYWKNSFSKQLEKQTKLGIKFDIETAKSVCETISKFNEYIDELDKDEKNKIKTGDLPFMYILNKTNNNFDKTKDLFKQLSQGLVGKPLKDFYRSKEIYSNIKKLDI
ncbi:MAG: AIPR family protein [Candidatus Izemoplasmatales bacterium]|nr:AIPR family protein [Candidatus Cloacimonadota bacterium]MDY0138737.1 AIPR family protein [Candidatus Izemoplasmatales bacterium]